MRIGSLCSGAGMLDEGVRSVLGGEIAWHAETDPAASKVLAHHYPDVPNLGDLTTVDWRAVEPVEAVTAGYPCQPDSSAGKRLSEDDHRWIFPDIARAIGVLRPRLVLLENVQGHFVRGFRTVLGSLAALGFDADWTLVRASDVGAPHRRERLFVVAWPTADAGGEAGHVGSGLRASGEAGQWGRRLDDNIGSRTPNTDGAGSQGPESAWGRHLLGGSAPADSGGDGRDRDTELDSAPLGIIEGEHRRHADGRADGTDWGAYTSAIRRWERVLGRAAPAPTELATRGGQRLSPRFVEWMMGWPDGWVTDVPNISRNDALRICGNGVVPQQAAEALRRLLALDRAA